METLKSPLLMAQCKAYHSIEDISREIQSLLKIHSPKSLDIHISLPYSFIDPILNKFPANEFKVGAEIMLNTDKNSFTGSIAGKMLEEAKVKFTLIGTDQDRISHSANAGQLKNNVTTALHSNVQPYICIEETLQEFQDKASKEVLLLKLKTCLDGLTVEEMKNIFIIYNAEWISRTPWENSSPEIHAAYKIFREVVNEATGEGNISSSQLIVAIPAYSEDVSLLIKSLQEESDPFLGYSVGILGSSAEYLIPIAVKQTTATDQTSSDAKTLPVDSKDNDFKAKG